MAVEASFKSDFERLGFAVLPALVETDLLAGLCSEADRLLASVTQRGGVRNVLGKSELLTKFARSGPPSTVAVSLLGSTAAPTKLTIFDKTPTANWKVPFHQDVTITVQQQVDAAGFGPWSIKDGLPHVQPPIEVLEQILAIRVHLDDTPASNGALRVLPGTHRLGRLSDSQVSTLRSEVGEVICPVPSGGAMLMRPLLLHASSASAAPSRRRVLHLEYSAICLPADLAWA